MNDPWKYFAFPAAAVGGFVLSSTSMAVFIQQSMGLGQYVSQLIVVAGAGLVFGFLVDEVLPAYIEKVRGSGGEDFGGGDFDSGGGEGFDFDN